MNKIIIGVLVIAVLVGGWFLFHGATTVDYVADVAGEIDTLEADLKALEVEASAGTLTPAAAAAAQAKVATRIDAINAALATADETGLTEAQRKQLLTALTKLKGLFVTYRSVLTVVDETAAELPEAERRVYNTKKGGTYVGVSSLLATAIDTVESVAEDVIEDYQPEDTTPEEVTQDEFEMIVEETVEDAMSADDMGSSTEEVIEDALIIENVEADAEAEGGIDVEFTDETGEVIEEIMIIEDDMVGETEIEAEAEAEVEAEADATTTN